ncbi:hypothetical protein QW060_24775 [Myroides ceti]|uniref:Uncharacterized protein n=1 Tax=Paenimyroides ceti TaxID=395087 RepID=A0ABT8D443_9FLAO|nr:hypothetical protein [Paenimyroides ceti]MDN3710107.1 hypothetical protein [Paenimyroides ceti]
MNDTKQAVVFYEKSLAADPTTEARAYIKCCLRKIKILFKNHETSLPVRCVMSHFLSVSCRIYS